MQLHFSPSMSSITISSSNGLFDLMRIKIAAPHISYRTLFHAILIVTFLLPFFFILTTVVTLEGVKNCSSFDCLGRRLGPKILGKADDSMRVVTDLHKIFDQVNTEEIPAGLELPESFSEFVSEIKTNQYDAKTFAVKLKAMIFPNLDKVVLLADDVVIQRDLSPLWEINLGGKVIGAIETCNGKDAWVMCKRFKNYFNFSHPLIAKSLNPDENTWAYGMNIFDLHAWRKMSITDIYDYWLRERTPRILNHKHFFSFRNCSPVNELGKEKGGKQAFESQLQHDNVEAWNITSSTDCFQRPHSSYRPILAHPQLRLSK